MPTLPRQQLCCYGIVGKDDWHQAFIFTFTLCVTDQTCKVWDLSIGAELMSLDGHPNYVTRVRFCDMNKLVYSVSNSFVKVWDIRSGAKCTKVLRLVQVPSSWPALRPSLLDKGLPISCCCCLSFTFPVRLVAGYRLTSYSHHFPQYFMLLYLASRVCPGHMISPPPFAILHPH